eukprot:424321-Rhodomonas_salina.1
MLAWIFSAISRVTFKVAHAQRLLAGRSGGAVFFLVVLLFACSLGSRPGTAEPEELVQRNWLLAIAATLSDVLAWSLGVLCVELLPGLAW